MNSSTCEVAVIGAGAAGLAAAARLAEAGRSVHVLEARDRIGGRIWTRLEPDSVAPIELGAEFIHGAAPVTLGWLKRAGKGVLEGPDAHWRLENGRLHQAAGFFQEIQQTMRRNRARATHDLSLDAFLRELSHELSPQACQYARMMAEGFDAADTERISARAVVDEWTGEAMNNAPQLRPAGGYVSLLAALGSALPGGKVRLALQSIVQDIGWSRDSVQIRGEAVGGSFVLTARRAIVTLPLTVLQNSLAPAAPVRFSPPIAQKQRALQGLALGPVMKLILQFRAAFWEEIDGGRYRDASFLHAPDCPFPTFWTALPLRAPWLVAWAGGPRAARLSEKDKPTIVTDALASLNRIFGGRIDSAGELIAAYVHNWQLDPFAGGAYSYVTIGGGDARNELAAPLEDTLFFAGEATDTRGEAGTVAGALLSGERAAREVLQSLQ